MNAKSPTPVLIVVGGLPGVGKTTIARELAARCRLAYIRIDTIEQALASSDALAGDVGTAGYVVAYELARSNLAMGLAVLADCVNPLAATRQAWRAVAADTASEMLEVEVVCSDAQEHRRRVESRQTDIPGHALPSWQSLQGHDYERWATSRLVIDSARMSASDAAGLILENLPSTGDAGC